MARKFNNIGRPRVGTVKEAVIYTRVSPRPGDGQASIDQQIQACQEWADKNEIKVTHICEDMYKSGDDSTRVGLMEAIHKAPNGGYIIVRDMDRLCRSAGLFAWIDETLTRKNIRLITVNQEMPFNTDDPVAKFMRVILAATGELEKSTINRRQSDAYWSKVKAGKKPPAGLPYGWVDDPNREGYMIPSKEETSVIELIMTWYSEGISQAEIARRLTSMGVKKKRHGPGVSPQWWAKQIGQIIKRCHRLGTFLD